MKGNEQIIERLNARLADELTAVNQYIVHAEMCEDWGYGKLHDTIKARAIEEMKHAEELIARILFLEGKPTVSKLNPIHIGAKVDEQFKSLVGLLGQAVGESRRWRGPLCGRRFQRRRGAGHPRHGWDQRRRRR